MLKLLGIRMHGAWDSEGQRNQVHVSPRERRSFLPRCKRAPEKHEDTLSCFTITRTAPSDKPHAQYWANAELFF